MTEGDPMYAARHRVKTTTALKAKTATAAVIAVGLIWGTIASASGAGAASGLDPLQLAQGNQANCQILAAHATSTAQATRARNCVADQGVIIKALTPTVSPSGTASPTPTGTPTVSPTPPTTTPPTTTTPPPPPTTTAPPAATGCIPNPHLCGYPDATNTGPAVGTVFAVHSGNYYAGAGAVITNTDITGCLYVGGANVTVKNSRINTGGQCYYAVRNGVVGSEGDWSGLNISDTEVRLSALNGAYGVSYDNYTLTRVKFTESAGNPGADCMYAGKNVLVQDTYCQLGLYSGDNFAPGAPHFDAISSSGGAGPIVIRHNTLLNPNPQNAAILMSTNDGPIANVTIDNNLVSGGNFTVYCGTDSGGNVTGTNVFTNNRFKRGAYRFGPTTHCLAANPHTGNIFDDDNSPIPVS